MKPASSSNKTRTLSLLVTLVALPAVHAVDEVWDGSTDGAWATFTNWVSDTGAPGALDVATFDSAGGAIDIIDLGAGVTVKHISFDSAAVAPYTIGSGGVGVQTLTIDQAGANPDGINLSSTVAADQTINANIVMGDGSVGQFRFTNLSDTNDLVINGNISDGSGGTAGIQTLSFGNFSPVADKVVINGSIPAVTTATRIQFNVFGADIEMNGTVSGTGNTQRSLIRNGGTITVGPAGKMGEGSMVVSHGQLFLNNMTTPQLFDNGLTFGNATHANGPSTVTIAPGATLDQDGDITYVADSGFANTGLLTGGTVDLSGASRAVTVADNPLVAGSELTLSTMFRGTNIPPGTENAEVEDLTIRGAGTVSWNSTLDTTALQLVDVIFFEAKKTVIEAGGADFTPLKRNLLVRQRNNAALSDFEVELDINGQEMLVDGDLTLGSFGTANITVAQNVRVSDSADSPSSKIRLITAAGNDLSYNAGTTNDNITAFIEADLQIEDANATFNIGDGASDVDVEISGTITDEGAENRNVDKSGDGTLLLTATDNAYNVLNVQRGRAQITNGGALGDNDIQVGNNTTDGTFEYIGAGETLAAQIRVGDNNVTVGTRVGDGTISNTGSGTLTFSAGTFNEARIAAMTNRTLTFHGTSDIDISGTVQDNAAIVATIGVIKDGTNTVSLNGSNTYTGDTVVNTGRLNVNGTVGGNLTVAAGASVGGNATYAGTVTLGAGMDLHVDGTSGAITAEGAIDTSAGVEVYIDSAAAGAITVLNYDNSEANTIAIGHFTLAGGVPASGRVGAPVFVDTGSSITIDLGFEDRTWTGSTNNLWDINSSMNWLGGAGFFFDGDLVTFNEALVGTGTVDIVAATTPGSMTIVTTTTPYTFNGPGTLSIDGGLVVHNDVGVVVNTVLTGSGALIKQEEGGVNNTSNGTLHLHGANTYSGGTSIEEGRAMIHHSTAFGTGDVALVDAGGDSPSIQLGETGLTVANNLVISNTGGRKDLNLNVAGTGNASEISGAIVIDETADWAFQIRASAGDTLDLSGVISGPGTPRSRGAGTLVLSNAANSFAHRLRVDSAGVLEVASIGLAGANSAAGAGSSIIVGSENSDGTLSYTGTGGSTDRQVQFGLSGNAVDTPYDGAGGIESNGTGALVFTNAAFNIADTSDNSRVDARIFTLGGTNTDNNEVQGDIIDNAGTAGTVAFDNTVSLTKDGVGTWCLSGTNTYTGDTTVNNGELCFTTSGALPAGADVYVDAAGGGILNLDFAGTVSIGSLYIDGVQVVAGEWGSVGSGATNTSAALLGAGKLDVTVGGTALPNIIDIAVDVSGDVIITLDGPAAGLTVQRSNASTPFSFADVASTAGATTLTVDSFDTDPDVDGEDYYRVRE